VSAGAVSRALGLAVLAAAVWFLFAVRAVLAPFLAAGILAYLMNPLVDFMERRGVRRHSAVVLLYVAVLAVLVVVAYWAFLILLADLPRLRYALPGIIEKVRGAAGQMQALTSEEAPWLSGVVNFGQAAERGIAFLQQALDQAPAYLASAAELSFYLILVPFVAFFILRNGRDYFQALVDLCPNRAVEPFLSLVNEVDGVLGNYLRGILFEALAVGLMSAAGLMWLGVDNAALISAAAGLGNIIPYLGPTVGGVLGFAAALVQFGDVVVPLKVLALFAVVQFVDNWFLEPLIMRRSVDLHPVVVVFALICGAHVGGFWGVLLAVPAAGIILQLVKVFSVWYKAEFGRSSVSKELWEASAKPWIV
jgi:predicted PurR-regulated permease PerM